MLRVNSWDHIAQEILISTSRRFGKTISVSMFCAAMMLSCPGVEISIYSTCKHISQKILRNVQKFALLIADSDYATLNFSVKRENMEEINLQGPLGNTDIRIINSYPSKVCFNHIRQKSKSRKVEKSKSMLVKRLHHLHELTPGQEEGLLRVRGAHQREHVLQELCQQSVVVLSLEQEILQQEKEVTRFAADVKQRERRVRALLHMDKCPAQVDLEQRLALIVHLDAKLGKHGLLRAHASLEQPLVQSLVLAVPPEPQHGWRSEQDVRKQHRCSLRHCPA